MTSIEDNKILVEYDPENKIISTFWVMLDEEKRLTKIVLSECDLKRLKQDSNRNAAEAVGKFVLLLLTDAYKFLSDKSLLDEERIDEIERSEEQENLISIDKKNAQEIHKLAYSAIRDIATTLSYVEENNKEYKDIKEGIGNCGARIQMDIVDVLRKTYPDIDKKENWE